MNAASPSKGELRGVHILWIVLSFFGFVIAANVVFIVMALDTFPGEDVPRSYIQGLRYNDAIAERQAQAALGWRAGAELTQDESGAYVEIVLTDRDGAPLPFLDLAGDLRRPAQEGADRELRFVSMGEGVYRARLDALAHGNWRLHARAQNAAGQALDFERSFQWRSPTPTH